MMKCKLKFWLEIAPAGIALAFVLAFFGYLFWSQTSSIQSMIRTSIIESGLVSLTNEKRSDEDLPVLMESPILKKAAQAKADNMAAYGYFAHTSPTGKKFTDWLDEAGYDYMYAGENLAVKFNSSQSVTEAWMNSPTHKANILSPKYSETGIGLAEGIYKGKSTTFVVQFFGQPKIPWFLKTTDEKIVASGSWVDTNSEEKVIIVGKKAKLDFSSIRDDIVNPLLLRFLPL